jgi:hypothetical protein
VRLAKGGELSVGDILAPINDAWHATSKERVTTQWGNNLRDAEPRASPQPANQENVAIAIAPDSQYFVNKLGGVRMEEVILVDDAVYARGPRINTNIAPNTDPETWVKANTEKLPMDESMRYLLLARAIPAKIRSRIFARKPWPRRPRISAASTIMAVPATPVPLWKTPLTWDNGTSRFRSMMPPTCHADWYAPRTAATRQSASSSTTIRI